MCLSQQKTTIGELCQLFTVKSAATVIYSGLNMDIETLAKYCFNSPFDRVECRY